METNFGLHALDGEWHALLPRYLYVSQQLVGRRVLEVHCGRGVGSCLLRHLGVEELTSIDDRAGIVSDAVAGFSHLEGVFTHMGYGEMSFDSGSFDVVICLDERPSVTDRAFMDEVQRVLSDDGVFIGILPAWSAYGFEKILPNHDGLSGAVLRDSASELDPKEALKERFSKVHTVDQTPSLGFVFSRSGQGAAEGQKVALPGGALDEDPTAQLVFCAKGRKAVKTDSAEVALPYSELAAHLGGTMNELYQQIDMLDQRTMVFEGRADDDVQLIDDLEEEVRSQRALSHDQVAQLEELKQQLAKIASVPDLTMDFARLQVEMAGRQKDILELTAEFNRRFQDMVWSLEERDDYIDNLSMRIHEWERYGENLALELSARDLALAAQGIVLDRCQEQLSGLPGEASPRDEDEVEGEDGGGDPLPAADDGLTAVLRALEDEGRALREGLDAALGDRGEAEAAMLRMRDAMRLNSAELAAKSRYALDLEDRIVQEELQAQNFAKEVGGLYEEVNDLKKSLEKAEARTQELSKDVTKKKESVLNIEREMERRGEQILGFKRELMGKEIEVKNLERENISLLKAKSSRDADVKVARDDLAKVQALVGQRDAAIAEMKGQLEQHQGLKAKIEAQADQIEALETSRRAAPARKKTKRRASLAVAARKVIAAKVSRTGPKSSDTPAPYSDEWFQAQGYTQLGKSLWQNSRKLATSTSRYWVEITDLQDGRTKVCGSKARTTRVPNERLSDVLRARFGVSDRLSRQLIKALDQRQDR